jgi:DNA-binding NarL/FixJ family response regulator
MDVLRLLAQGLPNRQIGERLSINERTAKYHVASILAKLEAANRTEAVMVAIERGLVSV